MFLALVEDADAIIVVVGVDPPPDQGNFFSLVMKGVPLIPKLSGTLILLII